MTATAAAPATAPLRAGAVRAAGVVAAVLAVNLVILGVASAAGADFTFHQNGTELTVGVASVALLSVAPLGTGLLLTALIGLRWPAVTKVALVVGPALALVTIATMTLPADFGTGSTVALAMMHLALAPAAILAVLALRPRGSGQ
jgi:hypothetical protein